MSIITTTVIVPENHTDELFDLINEALLKVTPEQLKTIIRFIRRGKAPSLNQSWRLSLVAKLRTVQDPDQRETLLAVLDALIIAGRKLSAQS